MVQSSESIQERWLELFHRNPYYQHVFLPIRRGLGLLGTVEIDWILEIGTVDPSSVVFSPIEQALFFAVLDGRLDHQIQIRIGGKYDP